MKRPSHVVYDVPCPYCGAAADRVCRTAPKGNERVSPHRARVAALRKATGR